MHEVSVEDAAKQLPALVDRVNEHGDRLVLTRDGKPVAVLLAVDDYGLLEQAQDADDLRESREAIAEAEREGWVPLRQAIAERDARRRQGQ